MIPIVYTKHAEKKFRDLAALGVRVSKSQIEIILQKPFHTDEETDYPKKIASGWITENHILRIVYLVEDDIIRVITFYPARKGRYFL